MKKKALSFSRNKEDEISSTFRPQITSLVDVMAILLVFLIKNFSVQGELITPSADLQLPVSTSKKPVKPMFSIELTRNSILSDGEKITDIAVFKENDSLTIPLLYDWMLIQKAKITDSTQSKEVLIQSDRDNEFNILKRVMYTCSKAGFDDFSILVLQEE
jgi:biopolymer transport protein ExbD